MATAFAVGFVSPMAGSSGSDQAVTNAGVDVRKESEGHRNSMRR